MFSYPSYAASGGFKGAKVVLPTVDTGYKSYDKGRLFLPAGVNYVLNPSLEVPLTTGQIGQYETLDVASGPRATIIENPPVPLPEGFTKCIHLHHTQDYDNFYPTGAQFPCTEGEVYTVSAWMYAENIYNDAPSIGWSAAGRGWWECSTQVPNGGGFARYSKTAAVPAGGTFMDPIIATYEGTADIYICGIQVEKSPFPTPYFEGSREKSALLYPLSGALQDNGTGTIAARVVPLFDGHGNVTDSQPITAQSPGGQSRWYIASNGITWTTAEYDGSNYPSAGVEAASDPLVPHSLVMRHWSGKLAARVRGVDGSVSDTPCVLSGLNTLKFGSPEFNAVPEANCWIGPVAVSPYRITDAETATLDAMLTAGATGSDLYNWFKRKGYGGTLILPLESDSRGYIVDGGYGDNYAYTEVAASTDTGYEVYA